MTRNNDSQSDLLVSTDTKITAVFVVLGVALWLAARTVTQSQLVQFAVLIGVGVILPTILTERLN